jgi:hypothetical protein
VGLAADVADGLADGDQGQAKDERPGMVEGDAVAANHHADERQDDGEDVELGHLPNILNRT